MANWVFLHTNFAILFNHQFIESIKFWSIFLKETNYEFDSVRTDCLIISLEISNERNVFSSYFVIDTFLSGSFEKLILILRNSTNFTNFRWLHMTHFAQKKIAQS